MNLTQEEFKILLFHYWWLLMLVGGIISLVVMMGFWDGYKRKKEESPVDNKSVRTCFWSAFLFLCLAIEGVGRGVYAPFSVSPENIIFGNFWPVVLLHTIKTLGIIIWWLKTK